MFLRQCDEYAKTGTVTAGTKREGRKPQASTLTVADAAAQVRSLLGEINQGSVSTPRIDSLATALNKLKKPELDQLLATLQIAGKPKTKKGAIERVTSMLNSQLEMHVKAQAFDSD